MSPNISTRACRALLALLPEPGSLSGLLRYDAIRAELERALSRRAPKRKPIHRKPKSRTARAATSAVYEAVEARAGGRCECGCDCLLGSFTAAPILDHFFGRGHADETVETCWMLRFDCNAEKTSVTKTNARIWHERFASHCKRHGYFDSLEKVRANLGGRIASREAEQQRNLPGVGR